MREAWSHSVEERERHWDRRNRSMYENLALMDEMNRVQRLLHAIYVRCFYPTASDQHVVDHWLRLIVEPELYVEVREKRVKDGFDVLPLPMPNDIRIDTLIRRLLRIDGRQVFCEQYHATELSTATV